MSHIYNYYIGSRGKSYTVLRYSTTRDEFLKRSAFSKASGRMGKYFIVGLMFGLPIGIVAGIIAGINAWTYLL